MKRLQKKYIYNKFDQLQQKFDLKYFFANGY